VASDSSHQSGRWIFGPKGNVRILTNLPCIGQKKKIQVLAFHISTTCSKKLLSMSTIWVVTVPLFLLGLWCLLNFWIHIYLRVSPILKGCWLLRHSPNVVSTLYDVNIPCGGCHCICIPAVAASSSSYDAISLFVLVT
jgi:hypothetical protein